jgi:hypothetical protein
VDNEKKTMCTHRKVEYGSKHKGEEISNAKRNPGKCGQLRNMYKGRKERNNVVEGRGLEVERAKERL